ncbi:SDR family oxidoreductase [Rhodococcus sp. NPDC058521]|uniref:SDR family oxidoreductase n=1 Tax=Rhodococcus sp. NPDC058521 TaxID=3346536 RepID=UPI00365D9C53
MSHVLVTGASGLVGAEVVSRLTARNVAVTALSHRTPLAESVTRVIGDVRVPDLGIAAADLEALASEVTAIVHCGATTAFDAAPEVYEELNVQGTGNVVELARRWDVPLVHVSTAYVCGERNGVVAENDLDVDQMFGNLYERSKFRAEKLVREADGLQWTVIRPGIVSGNSETGAIREYKNLYTVLKLMVEGKLRSLPGRYDATLALAPLDHVADVVVAAVLDFDEARGRTFHAVGADALSLREVSDVLAEYPSFEIATFVPPTSFSDSDLEGTERDYYLRVGSLYTSYFHRRLAFDVSGAEKLLGRPSPPSGPDYFRVVLDDCLESGYLGAPLPSIEEVLASLAGGAEKS